MRTAAVHVLLLATHIHVASTKDNLNELNEILIASTVRNDADMVGQLVEAGLNPDTISEKGVTVLMMASMMGHVEVVKRLLLGGAKIDATDDLGNQALMLSSAHGKTEVVKELLKAGAAVNALNKDGMTALMLASAEGQAGAARLLMEVGGARLDFADVRRGNQALHLASLRGDPDVARLVLLAGAATEARNHEGMTALLVASSVSHGDEAAGAGHAAVVRLLLAASSPRSGVG